MVEKKPNMGRRIRIYLMTDIRKHWKQVAFDLESLKVKYYQFECYLFSNI